MPRRNYRTKPAARRPIPATCQDKRSYPSEKAAEQAISKRTTVDDAQLRAYMCTICGKWHLTSQSR